MKRKKKKPLLRIYSFRPEELIALAPLSLSVGACLSPLTSLSVKISAFFLGAAVLYLLLRTAFAATLIAQRGSFIVREPYVNIWRGSQQTGMLRKASTGKSRYIIQDEGRSAQLRLSPRQAQQLLLYFKTAQWSLDQSSNG